MNVLVLTVYLSSVGVGLVALPQQAIAAIATPGLAPAQIAAKVVGSVDGGAGTSGYYLRTMMAAPSVVNLGNLNVTWQQREQTGPGIVGVRLGALNTTAPINCPGSGVLLQLDAQVGDYAAKLSRIGGTSDTIATRVEYTCGPLVAK